MRSIKPLPSPAAPAASFNRYHWWNTIVTVQQGSFQNALRARQQLGDRNGKSSADGVGSAELENIRRREITIDPPHPIIRDGATAERLRLR
jgi:hypothetical protein